MCLLPTKWAGKSASPSSVLVGHLLVQESTSQSSCSMKSPPLSHRDQALLYWSTSIALVRKLSKLPPSGRRKVKDILLRFKYYLSRGDGRNQAQLVDQLDKLLDEALKLVYLDHSGPSLSPNGLPYPLLWDETATKSHPAKYGPADQYLSPGRRWEFDLGPALSKIAPTEPDQSCSWPTWWHRTLSASLPQSGLPKREEFETRATLLQLLREAETFIQVKVDFYQKYGN